MWNDMLYEMRFVNSNGIDKIIEIIGQLDLIDLIDIWFV